MAGAQAGERTMATLDRATSTHDAEPTLHVSVRGLDNGRWEVVCDRIRGPLANMGSAEAAFEFAMDFAVDHSPSTVEMAD